jgi:hypothetical protein
MALSPPPSPLQQPVDATAPNKPSDDNSATTVPTGSLTESPDNPFIEKFIKFTSRVTNVPHINAVEKSHQNKKIAIGATVQERSGAKCSGLTVGNGSGELTWMVHFERSENEEQLPSSHFKLVQDNSEYIWTIVKDSSPEQNKAVTEYCDTGLMGIHFGENCSDTLSSSKY